MKILRTFLFMAIVWPLLVIAVAYQMMTAANYLGWQLSFYDTLLSGIGDVYMVFVLFGLLRSVKPKVR